MSTDTGAAGFVGEPVEVEFEQAPALEKVPDCPDRFVWRGEVFVVVEKLREWHDYRRRGYMGRNMAPHHLQTAGRRGSWGVGRDYFRVRTTVGRVFDLYYDRAPSAGGRKGGWFLYREVNDESVALRSG
jgi:hypothetical protein